MTVDPPNAKPYPNAYPNDTQESDYPNAKPSRPSVGDSHTTEELLDFLNAQTVDRLEEHDKPKIIESSRSARLKFEIPKTPSRQSAPMVPDREREQQSPKRRWSSPALRNKRQASILEEGPPPIQVGSRVKLLGRPLQTLGTVQYMGDMHLSPGEWIGVLLDERVGTHNGTVDGNFYFEAPAHKGIFLKRSQLEPYCPPDG
ncbi:hypothetical protein NQZ79_g6473 [Umbelopsis isabellina]|nr:hypothetical protein NQZ79_g6473 [Umbelopsis isabellina]